MTHRTLPLLLLCALALPASAWPEQFTVTGTDGDTPVTGDLTFTADGQLTLDLPDLHLAASLSPRGEQWHGQATGGPGIAGRLQQQQATPAHPWRVTLTPQGHTLQLTLQHGLRSTRRGLRRVPGAERRTLQLTAQADLGPRNPAHEALIERFYTAFQNKNADAMAAEYADAIHFSDPVFPNLHGPEAGAMWAMLCESEDLQLTFSGIEAGDRYGVAHWEATYTVFGNQVHNVIDASFEFQNGQIIRHVDHFDFAAWANQGLRQVRWLPKNLIQHVVRHFTARQLRAYMES